MSEAHSKRAIIVGIACNATLTAAKFVGWGLSGSGAMLSEAIHSVADTSNQALLLLGVRHAARAANERHPYGYGRARFFWGLVSALGIFFLGAGVTLYHGVSAMLHPTPSDVGPATWGILVLSLVFEGCAGAVALLELRRSAAAARTSLLRYIREGRDPTTIAVLLEDGAAVLGVVLAALGMGLNQLTGWPGWDALASIAIGVLLAVVAVFLVAKNQSFLLTLGIDPDMADRLRRVIAERPSVEGVVELRGIHHAIDRVGVSAAVDFDGRRIARGLLEGEDIDALAKRLREPAALSAYLAEFAERVTTRVGVETAVIESRVKDAVPEAKDVDIEVR